MDEFVFYLDFLALAFCHVFVVLPAVIGVL